MTVGLSGYIRQVDSMGRVVLPQEWRRCHQVEPGISMELVPGRDGSLLMRRYTPGGACLFCGELEDLLHFAGRPICRRCAVAVGAAAGS